MSCWATAVTSTTTLTLLRDVKASLKDASTIVVGYSSVVWMNVLSVSLLVIYSLALSKYYSPVHRSAGAIFHDDVLLLFIMMSN